MLQTLFKLSLISHIHHTLVLKSFQLLLQWFRLASLPLGCVLLVIEVSVPLILDLTEVIWNLLCNAVHLLQECYWHLHCLVLNIYCWVWLIRKLVRYILNHLCHLLHLLLQFEASEPNLLIFLKCADLVGPMRSMPSILAASSAPGLWGGAPEIRCIDFLWLSIRIFKLELLSIQLKLPLAFVKVLLSVVLCLLPSRLGIQIDSQWCILNLHFDRFVVQNWWNKPTPALIESIIIDGCILELLILVWLLLQWIFTTWVQRHLIKNMSKLLLFWNWFIILNFLCICQIWIINTWQIISLGLRLCSRRRTALLLLSLFWWLETVVVVALQHHCLLFREELLAFVPFWFGLMGCLRWAHFFIFYKLFNYFDFNI